MSYMTQAPNNYLENLRVFQRMALAGPRVKLKLAFNPTRGLFEAQEDGKLTALKRTFSLQKQSVTNDANFAIPLRETFLKALEMEMPRPELDQALQGLRKMRTAYNDEPAKLRKLGEVLAEIHRLIEPNYPRGDLEFLQAWRLADPAKFFSDADFAFLHQIFANKQIMEELPSTGGYSPAMVSQKIYGIYNGVLENHLDKVDSPVDWLQALPKTFNPSLQNHGVVIAGNENRIVKSQRKARDFIYYSTELQFDAQLWRVYLNFGPRDAAAVLKTIVQLTSTRHIKSFKIAGPLGFHTRCDKIVAYVYSQFDAKAVAVTLKDKHGDAFRDPIPHMTHKLHPGVAVGVEPAKVALGFSRKEAGGKKGKSYGSIRSDLLASAVLHYFDNKTVLCKGPPPVTPEEAFLKCAVVAFQSYDQELNPEHYKYDQDDEE
jgi:hypothetical protein